VNGARAAPPSIRARLANALALWSVLWGLAVGVAVWQTVAEEVDELLDDSLRGSAELLAGLVLTVSGPDAPADRYGGQLPAAEVSTFAWQVVAADGRVLMRSALAPRDPWHAVARAGMSDRPGWRIVGLALGREGRMLYAAQSHAERREARTEVAIGSVLASLAVGLLGHLWLRGRVRAELQPLVTLADRLGAARARPDAADDGTTTRVAPLGDAERLELQPVHEAIDALVARLAARAASERAFAAHAAHALRTPLAGIDAQLAVALRESPPALAARLARVRGAAARLQGVVAALLGLFRTGAAPRRTEIDLPRLLARLPADGLDLAVPEGARLSADADLLAAALLNLLDNAQRHGARHVAFTLPAPGVLRLHDDGPGLPEPVREALQAALDSQADEPDAGQRLGLGLVLADRVARAHGGRLRLMPADLGFAVEIDLGAAAALAPG
jgi:signal transduction histidine kinase